MRARQEQQEHEGRQKIRSQTPYLLLQRLAGMPYTFILTRHFLHLQTTQKIRGCEGTGQGKARQHLARVCLLNDLHSLAQLTVGRRVLKAVHASMIGIEYLGRPRCLKKD